MDGSLPSSDYCIQYKEKWNRSGDSRSSHRKLTVKESTEHVPRYHSKHFHIFPRSSLTWTPGRSSHWRQMAELFSVPYVLQKLCSQWKRPNTQFLCYRALFMRRHSSLIGVPEQWNADHVGVLNQSCKGSELLSHARTFCATINSHGRCPRE